MGLVAVAVALAGFAQTFILPVSAGRFKAPAIVYLHGASAFTWICIFAGQPLWLRAGRFGAHRLAGIIGAAAAGGFVLTTPFVGAYAVTRDYQAGGGEAALSGIVGNLSSPLIFASLVIAGILTRRTPETHKRLMLLATIVILWPAWFRFRHYFPDVPRPEIVFGVVIADSLVLAAAMRDWFSLGKIHSVWTIAGTALIGENIAELILFDTPAWRALAHALLGLLGA